MLSNEANDAADRLRYDLAPAVLPEPSADDVPEPPPFAIDRDETLAGSTDSFVEAVELDAERGRGLAGIFAQLEAGSARYRVRAPGGQLFAEGQTRSGEPLERIVVIPPPPGPLAGRGRHRGRDRGALPGVGLGLSSVQALHGRHRN